MGLGGKDKGWKKGPWTHEEDKLLSEYVSLHGEGRWSHVAKFAGLNRSGKSCRLRWVNYLRPGLKKGQLTPQEEGIIFELHALLGNKWSTIAKYLPGRTDNEIKNYWRTHFKKKDKPSRRKLDKHRAHNMPKQIKPDSESYGVKTISSSDYQPPETKTEQTKTPSNNNKDQMAANIIMQPTVEEQCVPNLMYDVFSSSWSDSNNAVGDESLLVSLWDHFDELPQAQHADHVTEFGKLCGMQNQAAAAAAAAAAATTGGDSGKLLAIQNQAWFDEIFNNLGCGKYLFG